MPSYYRSNAVYDRLHQIDDHPFVWTVGNAWTLIYGEGTAPTVIVFVRGTSATTGDVAEEVQEAARFAEKIAERAQLPFRVVTFDDRVNEIERVTLSRTVEGAGDEVTLDHLRDEFGGLGLPVRTGAAAKAVNDATSSAYHDWQRANLGRIVVTDLDLLRVEDGEVTELIELKRSYIELNRWTPFTNDFANFDLAAAVASRIGARFTIAYNVRRKNPWHDDASTLSTFAYNDRRAVKHGEYDFDAFVEGVYL